MIGPFVVFYIVPLLVEGPWIATTLFLFFVSLHALGRVRAFSDTTYSFLPRADANRMRSRTEQQERRYVWWCMSGAGVFVGAVALRVLLPDSALAGRIFVGAIVGVLSGCAYAPVYHDKSELLGERARPWLRRLGVWAALQSYFNLQPIYMHNAPPDMPVRDERRQTMKNRGLSAVRIEYEMNVTDTHTLQSCKNEPRRFFTFSRAKYEDVVRGRRATGAEIEGPHARRPRVYAAHPHGLSAITAAFGVLMYGPDSMLPEPDNVRVAVADALFYLPIVREWALAVGCISAAREAIAHNLGRSRDVMLYPGGMLEQAMADYRRVEIVWSRFGFCNIAYRHRASIVPICAFGENDTYIALNAFPALRLRNYRRFGYAFPWLFAGPLPASLTPVIGLPIDTTRQASTDAARRRAQRYLDRKGVHPDDAFGPPRRKGEDSDGDTPLVDLDRVSRSLSGSEIDVCRPVDDYYGEGYSPDSDTALLRRAEWGVERNDELADDSFVTLIDTTLDEENLIEGSFVADLQRAVYAQFVDMRDCAVAGVPGMLPDFPVGEEWGATLDDLKARLNRDGQSRNF